MKLLAISFAAASANLATLEWFNMTEEQRAEWCKDEYWRVGDVVEHPKECDQYLKGDALEGQLMLFTGAQNYGCWCDLDGALKRKSRGQPVNALDKACMDLHHGYNCITVDMPNCNPRVLNATDDYVLPLTAISPIMDPQVECQNYNTGNTCGYRTCQVEAHFLRTTYMPVFQGDSYWLDMWNDNTMVHTENGGTFDFTTTCLRPGGGPGSCTNPPCSGNVGPHTPGTTQCCGQYPLRNPFYTGRHQCCNDVISPLGTC